MRFTWPPRQASADPAPKPTSDAPSGSRGPYWDSSESDLLYCSKEIKSQYSSARMSHSCSDLRENGEFRLCGECYVHGLMHGEAIDKWENGDFQDQTFTLA